MVVRTIQTTVLSDFIMHIWFDGGPADGDDPTIHYVVEFEIEPSIYRDGRFFNDFTMNWKHEDDTDAAPDRGSMSITHTQFRTYIKMLETQDGGS